MGLPSSVEARAPPDPPRIPNHDETALDPAIQSQMTGSQSALELRADRSRSRKNSPAIPVLQIRKASQNIIRSSSASPLASTWSELSRCSRNGYSVGQARLPAYSLQVLSLLSKDCFVQPVHAHLSCSRSIHQFYACYSECEGRKERYVPHSNSEIEMAEARAEDLEDRNLG